MMTTRVFIIDGHPDPSRERFCHAGAKAYGDAAEKAGHAVERLTHSGMDIFFLCSKAEWEEGQGIIAAGRAQSVESIGSLAGVAV